ncbi:MAG: NUDIX hydrolase, partial [Anaerolineae bacterium]|nr:NUDIX hydrolase [Thermoflexales bacterium]MDW8407362.1 NUDIX hydrolase [Anaerolineae bacterium]
CYETMKSMHRSKTLSRKAVLERGKYLTVEDHAIQLPDGRTIEQWPWLVTPDFVNIAVLTTGGLFLCFRQTKYAVPGVSLAVAGGYIEPGEEPLHAARRELLEETGYQAEHWTPLGHYAVDGNRGAGVAHLFLAQDAQRVAEINADDLEEQEMVMLSTAQVRTALAEGEFKCLSWAAVMSLALLHLGM